MKNIHILLKNLKNITNQNQGDFIMAVTINMAGINAAAPVAEAAAVTVEKARACSKVSSALKTAFAAIKQGFCSGLKVVREMFSANPVKAILCFIIAPIIIIGAIALAIIGCAKCCKKDDFIELIDLYEISNTIAEQTATSAKEKKELQTTEAALEAKLSTLTKDTKEFKSASKELESTKSSIQKLEDANKKKLAKLGKKKDAKLAKVEKGKIEEAIQSAREIITKKPDNKEIQDKLDFLEALLMLKEQNHA